MEVKLATEGGGLPAGPYRKGSRKWKEAEAKEAARVANIPKGFEGHKLCPFHGTQYLLIRDPRARGQTGMCGHPSCIDNMLAAIAKSDGLLRFWFKLYPNESLLKDWIIEKLLKEAREGKPTIIHKGPHLRWLVCGALKEMAKREKKQEVAQLCDPSGRAVQKAMHEALAEALEWGEVDGGGGWHPTHRAYSQGPARLFDNAELIWEFKNAFGVDGLLWALGVITTREFAKLRECKATEVLFKAGMEAGDLRKWYKLKFG